jgi:hypothetical protein
VTAGWSRRSTRSAAGGGAEPVAAASLGEVDRARDRPAGPRPAGLVCQPDRARHRRLRSDALLPRISARRRGAAHCADAGAPLARCARGRRSVCRRVRSYAHTVRSSAGAVEGRQRRRGRLAYEGRVGAYWLLLGPGVEHRRSDYDLDRAVAWGMTLDDQALSAQTGPPHVLAAGCRSEQYAQPRDAPDCPLPVDAHINSPAAPIGW